ncbi:hypothetical protein [Kitasatospora paranensis]|uniref:Uncharacterized protein n=1 Tax=Kitasatospora paranensis TaxID=258053 RepID=A0ABW2FZW7_9ACTN
MRTAANGQNINLQQLTIPDTKPGQAASYLAGLAAQHCTLIITVGSPGSAIPALLKADPRLHFTAIDSPLTAPSANLTLLTHADLTGPLTSQIRGLAPSEAATGSP